MNDDLKVKETVDSWVSLSTVGTFGIQLEIHIRASDWEKLPRSLISLSGNYSSSEDDSGFIRSCRFRGLRGTSRVAHVASLSPAFNRGNTKIWRLPYCPSAVRILSVIWFVSSESTFRVVSNMLPCYESSIAFSLHFLSSIFRMSTDWLHCNRIVSIGS